MFLCTFIKNKAFLPCASFGYLGLFPGQSLGGDVKKGRNDCVIAVLMRWVQNHNHLHLLMPRSLQKTFEIVTIHCKIGNTFDSTPQDNQIKTLNAKELENVIQSFLLSTWPTYPKIFNPGKMENKRFVLFYLWEGIKLKTAK